MKQYMRRVVLALCMMTCLFSLSACGSKAAEESTELDPQVTSYVSQVTEGLLGELTSMDEAQATETETQLLRQGEEGLATGVTSWISVLNDTGALTEVISNEVEAGEDETYICVVNAAFEKRDVEFRAIYEMDNTQQTLVPVSMTFSPVYSTGERMTTAAMNTLLGMGTVFCVLIFISLLISCFKFINKFETAMKNKADAATAAAAPVAPAPVAAVAETENLTDDLELVAVITAAIAAAGNTSTDGLVVRSIKRVPSAKWKRA